MEDRQMLRSSDFIEGTQNWTALWLSPNESENMADPKKHALPSRVTLPTWSF